MPKPLSQWFYYSELVRKVLQRLFYLTYKTYGCNIIGNTLYFFTENSYICKNFAVFQIIYFGAQIMADRKKIGHEM